MKLNIIKVFSLLLLLGAASCTSYRDMPYFQKQGDPKEFETQSYADKSVVRFQPDDILAITVNVVGEQKIALDYNLPVQPVATDVEGTGADVIAQGLGRQNYLVLRSGEIDFPTLGLIKVVGYTQEELLSGNVNYTQLLHPTDAEQLETLNKSFLQSDTHEHVYRVFCKDKTVKWIWERSKVIETNPDGTPLTIEGYTADVTERLELEKMTLSDPLTRIPNRRAFNKHINSEWQRALREKTPLGLMIIDADHFKAVNDQHGHLQGDVVLQSLAQVITNSIKRSTDFAARWGGEEFCVLLPNTKADGVKTIAEFIRINVEKTAIPFVNDSNRTMNITISIGCASLVPSCDSSIESFIDIVDHNLYKAKESGRNRVVI